MRRPMLHPLLKYEVHWHQDGRHRKVETESRSAAEKVLRHQRAEGRDPSLYIGELEVAVA